ncbi:hypothetical protein DFP72DRAFT_1176107 [Ephemerocybe angulata]|uniref:Uncharacterized protein n=1 Tax=Ephemerocybe angulata TaxID=980116 RepID=A0A8H6LYE4_9AGAR|nr:hypothetical protein DFP72DRAFT_1176107 [Tulosesus angulatus]
MNKNQHIQPFYSSDTGYSSHSGQPQHNGYGSAMEMLPRNVNMQSMQSNIYLPTQEELMVIQAADSRLLQFARNNAYMHLEEEVTRLRAQNQLLTHQLESARSLSHSLEATVETLKSSHTVAPSSSSDSSRLPPGVPLNFQPLPAAVDMQVVTKRPEKIVFWYQQEWKDRPETFKAPPKTPQDLAFIQNEKGVYATSTYVRTMFEYACLLWGRIVFANLSPLTWGERAPMVLEYFASNMIQAFPELGLCHPPLWKANAFATAKYPDFKKHKRPALLAQYESSKHSDIAAPAVSKSSSSSSSSSSKRSRNTPAEASSSGKPMRVIEVSDSEGEGDDSQRTPAKRSKPDNHHRVSATYTDSKTRRHRARKPLNLYADPEPSTTVVSSAASTASPAAASSTPAISRVSTSLTDTQAVAATPTATASNAPASSASSSSAFDLAASDQVLPDSAHSRLSRSGSPRFVSRPVSTSPHAEQAKLPAPNQFSGPAQLVPRGRPSVLPVDIASDMDSTLTDFLEATNASGTSATSSLVVPARSSGSTLRLTFEEEMAMIDNGTAYIDADGNFWRVSGEGSESGLDKNPTAGDLDLAPTSSPCSSTDHSRPSSDPNMGDTLSAVTNPNNGSRPSESVPPPGGPAAASTVPSGLSALKKFKITIPPSKAVPPPDLAPAKKSRAPAKGKPFKTVADGCGPKNLFAIDYMTKAGGNPSATAAEIGELWSGLGEKGQEVWKAAGKAKSLASKSQKANATAAAAAANAGHPDSAEATQPSDT